METHAASHDRPIAAWATAVQRLRFAESADPPRSYALATAFSSFCNAMTGKRAGTHSDMAKAKQFGGF